MQIFVRLFCFAFFPDLCCAYSATLASEFSFLQLIVITVVCLDLPFLSCRKVPLGKNQVTLVYRIGFFSLMPYSLAFSVQHLLQSCFMYFVYFSSCSQWESKSSISYSYIIGSESLKDFN